MPDTTLSRILPPNRTPLEAAVADAAAVINHDDSTIPTLYRPRDIAAPLLPWLAWSVDVLAWPRRASEDARRGLVAGSWRLHRLQGTLAGFREIAKVFGGEVVGVIKPPAKLYAAPSLTTTERNAFVARYPQLRLYRYRTVGQRIGLHCGDVLGRWSPVQSDALLRITPRAYIYRDGQEAELTVIERRVKNDTRSAVQAATVTEVAIPGQAGRLSFVGRHPRHLTATEAARRFYRMTLTETYQDSSEQLRRVTAQPGLTPIDVRPDAIAQTGQATGIHAGQFIARHLSPSTARDRIYQRLYLFDPEVDVSRRSATLHLNAGRLGMPAHHAELALRIPGERSKQAAGRYCRGYLVAANHASLTDCLAGMRDVMRASDRIAINTRIKRPVTAGESLIAGQTVAGDWIDN